ncbi:MAG: YihA family ribosome biogenesis GTP-binding protein [Bacteroidales bacterium]|nr:YihA family ribosome biogenesis GTP-binding protein [Bacteroidales bacterium]MBQ5434886.1 YihA family ribosome biogenesis GTP-binding protein [Bacteroidales bacterium]MBQ5482211.1 YihA family ribosome biogenesis GTP-binding protein [Bacteroidales bacterium]MBQ5518430.1 YihA family ribosome biogenesis GTP-binding protein [Bacteroidales bacterium]
MIIKQALFAGSSQHTDQKPKTRHPEFAFIGRSNVGKSSLINRLCNQKGLAHTSATPGKTQLVNHFLINDAWYLVDLPGYGYARMGKKGREKLQDIISDYILHSEDLVLLFVLLDSRHDLQQIDRDFIDELGAEGIPFALIYTKCDKLGPVALQTQVDRNAAVLAESWEELPPTFCTSSETGQGREEILSYIETILQQL